MTSVCLDVDWKECVLPCIAQTSEWNFLRLLSLGRTCGLSTKFNQRSVMKLTWKIHLWL